MNNYTSDKYCLPSFSANGKICLVKKVLDYLSEVRGELRKVTWPKRQEVIKLTLIVFIISGIVALYVGGWDFLFTKFLGLIVAH